MLAGLPGLPPVPVPAPRSPVPVGEDIDLPAACLCDFIIDLDFIEVANAGMVWRVAIAAIKAIVVAAFVEIFIELVPQA